jgi:hypothetical protein
MLSALAHAGRRALCTSGSAAELRPALTIADLAKASARPGCLVSRLQTTKRSDSVFHLPADMPIGLAAHHLVSNRLTFALVDSGEEGIIGKFGIHNVMEYVSELGNLAFVSSGSCAVRQWMTDVDELKSVRMDDTLEHTLRLILKPECRIWRHMPVLDYWNKLHAIVDVRDVVLEVIGQKGLDAWQGSTASDVLGTKRRNEIEHSSTTSASSMAPPLQEETGRPPLQRAFPHSGGWRAQLESYLLGHAQRFTISARASVEHAAHQMRSERLTFLVVVETQESAIPCTFPVPSLYLPCTFPVPSRRRSRPRPARGPRAAAAARPTSRTRRTACSDW